MVMTAYDQMLSNIEQAIDDYVDSTEHVEEVRKEIGSREDQLRLDCKYWEEQYQDRCRILADIFSQLWAVMKGVAIDGQYIIPQVVKFIDETRHPVKAVEIPEEVQNELAALGEAAAVATKRSYHTLATRLAAVADNIYKEAKAKAEGKVS